MGGHHCYRSVRVRLEWAGIANPGCMQHCDALVRPDPIRSDRLGRAQGSSLPQIERGSLTATVAGAPPSVPRQSQLAAVPGPTGCRSAGPPAALADSRAAAVLIGGARVVSDDALGVGRPRGRGKAPGLVGRPGGLGIEAVADDAVSAGHGPHADLDGGGGEALLDCQVYGGGLAGGWIRRGICGWIRRSRRDDENGWVGTRDGSQRGRRDRHGLVGRRNRGQRGRRDRHGLVGRRNRGQRGRRDRHGLVGRRNGSDRGRRDKHGLFGRRHRSIERRYDNNGLCGRGNRSWSRFVQARIFRESFLANVGSADDRDGGNLRALAGLLRGVSGIGKGASRYQLQPCIDAKFFDACPAAANVRAAGCRL